MYKCAQPAPTARSRRQRPKGSARERLVSALFNVGAPYVAYIDLNGVTS
jgi:hypothetical protein